tara:strand:- start:3822 stop:4082 length:261 start_codon:yes stop_codon:yes gene_type:complete
MNPFPVMRVSVFIISALIIIGWIIYSLTGYRSAFEADRECHYILKKEYSEVFSSVGCDHDLETRQWLLFQENFDDQPAKVIKRFRY